MRLKDFKEEGTFWKTFYRKVKCNLIGAAPERWVIKPWIRGNAIDVGCGRNQLKGTVGVDNLLANTYAGWKAKPLLIADALDLPFKDCTLDTVIAMHLWEHIDTPAEFIDEARRVLKPGGRLCLVLPNRKYLGKTVYWRDPTHKWEAWPEYVDMLFDGDEHWNVLQFNKLASWHYHWSFDVILEKR
jgi:SAM-dependent methyltransferase